MDYKTKILLGEEKNINTVNVDNLLKIKLENIQSPIIEYNIQKYINSSEVFEIERENSNIYKLYGCIDYMSLFNGLTISDDINIIEDFFIKKNDFETTKNLINSFNFYLLIPHNEYELIEENNNIKTYHKKYKVIATDDDMILINAGFSNNIFNEPKYYFQFNLDFDISNMVDGIGFPITELYLYAEYIPNKRQTSEGHKENLYYRNKNINPIGDFNEFYELHPINYIDFNKWEIGDVFNNIGSIIKYNKKEYSNVEILSQNFIIEILINHGDDKYIKWEYNPFIPIKIRYLSSTISRANRNSTSYQQRMSIPYYAVDLDNNGNVVWREILEDGVFDPITDVGVDYPFINGKKYVYNNIALAIIPFLSDSTTKNIFNEIIIDNYDSISITPVNDDIDEMLNVCV